MKNNIDPLLKEFNNLIKDSNKTQLQLAEETGIAVNTINSWFNDARSPGLYNFKDCLDCLGYDLKIIKNNT